MKTKTKIFVSIALVLAIITLAVIATFPKHLLEDDKEKPNPPIQSGNISEVPDDTIDMSEENVGIEGVLPTIDDEEIGLSENPNEVLTLLDKSGSAVLMGEKGAFPEGTKVKLSKLTIFNKDYYLARHYIEDIAKDFSVYEVSATLAGESTIPKALVRLTIDIPKNYDIQNTALYYLLSDGVQELDYSFNQTDKTISVKVSQPGVFILVEKKPVTEQDNIDGNSSQDSSTSSETNSTPNSSDDSQQSSDSTEGSNPESSDPNKESMDGWTPWH